VKVAAQEGAGPVLKLGAVRVRPDRPTVMSVRAWP